MIKNCKSCFNNFEITNSDLEFYKKVSPEIGGIKQFIPAPSYCYRCRQNRKLTWRNERTLYRRKCDLTNKDIVSTYHPDSNFKVYEFNEWFTDKWDPMDYAQEFDFSKTFFEQFNELHLTVPLPSLFVYAGSENSDYTNLSQNNRNAYLIFAASHNEDCMYSTYLQRNRDVVDCFFIFDSELCYECIDCYNCYNVLYSNYSNNCSDSYFLQNCIGCSECFGCVSLRNKKYHLFNKEYSKENYQKEVNKILAQQDFINNVRKEMKSLLMETPQPYYSGINNENITGDHVSFSKNTFHSFDCTYLEDCKNCTWMHKAKDCYDCYAWGLDAELGYENHLCGDNVFHVLFSECCFSGVSNLLYSRYCTQNCNKLFGCIGLKQKQHCILNKQYSKKEYETLVPKIIQHMKETGEWGEFFLKNIHLMVIMNLLLKSIFHYQKIKF